MKFSHALIGVLLLTLTAMSATIYVPDDYAAIQDAIDNSSDGDTVLVRPGTYFENVEVNRLIVLQSTDGPGTTIIDGNDAASVVKLVRGGVVLDGFTIRNGNARRGGGIHCVANATVTNNIITQNEAHNQSSEYAKGAGFYAMNTTITISDNLFSHNSGEKWGGAMCLEDNVAGVISDNIFEYNTAGNGGAISCIGRATYCDDRVIDIVISQNVIRYNQSSGAAAGIDCNRCEKVTIARNFIHDNDNLAQYGAGGGISTFSGNDTLITDNLIIRNRANNTHGYGGGIVCRYDRTVINNCTICFNQVNHQGGGIYVDLSSTESIDINNTILWDNDGDPNSGPQLHFTGGGGTLNFRYSDSMNGMNDVYVYTGCVLNWGPGMIDADPLFADTSRDDLHLTWDSPCRDAGDDSVVTELTDFELDPRSAFGAVDMGADEYYYHLYRMGDVVPGSSIDLKVVGYPTAKVALALNDFIVDPPLNTPHGDLYITWPMLWSGQIGKTPSTGILLFTTTVPAVWVSGDQYYLQALVGQWGDPAAMFTNYEALTVK